MTARDENDLLRAGHFPADPREGLRRLESANHDGRKALTECLANVVPEAITWLWDQRIANGKLAILDGPPAAGKSTFMLDIVARLTTGRPMPFEHVARPAASVLIVAPEDGTADTIVPRLVLAGADLERVFVLARIETKDGQRLVRIPDDVPLIENTIREKRAALVIIDSLMSTLGERDTHRDAAVRSALLPLADLAERTKAAIVAIRHHSKAAGGTALTRGIGSIAFTALARSVLTLAPSPDDPDLRVVALAKVNVARPPASLGFKLVSAGQHARVEWIGEVAFSADDLVSQPSGEKEPRKRRQAKALLLELLAGGPVDSRAVESAAVQNDIAWATMRRAKKDLRIKSKKIGKDRWVWFLPGADAEGDQLSEMSTFTASDRRADVIRSEMQVESNDFEDAQQVNE